MYFDKKSSIYKFKDFGDAEYSGDCFFFVSKIFGLTCDDRQDFIKILEIIDNELGLCLEDNDQKVNRVVRENKGEVQRASSLPSIHDGFETAKTKLPIQTREFNETEIQFWAQYGITKEILDRFNVTAIERFIGIGKDGKEYAMGSTVDQPMFGYNGRRYTKLYRPYSNLRFLYIGEVTESYVFGFDQLPIRGDVLFITGGEYPEYECVEFGYGHGVGHGRCE